MSAETRVLVYIDQKNGSDLNEGDRPSSPVATVMKGFMVACRLLAARLSAPGFQIDNRGPETPDVAVVFLCVGGHEPDTFDAHFAEQLEKLGRLYGKKVETFFRSVSPEPSPRKVKGQCVIFGRDEYEVQITEYDVLFVGGKRVNVEESVVEVLRVAVESAFLSIQDLERRRENVKAQETYLRELQKKVELQVLEGLDLLKQLEKKIRAPKKRKAKARKAS